MRSEFQNLHLVVTRTLKNLVCNCPYFFINPKRGYDFIGSAFSTKWNKISNAIIVVHNHPSGELKPSKEDKLLTDRLIQVGKFHGIPVLDHLVISLDSYLSFVDTGLYKELEENSVWKLPIVKD